MLQLANCTAPTCQVVHFITLRIFSSAPCLRPGADLNISLSHSLSELLTEWVTYQARKLKISVNIDARNIKYDMKHSWGYWLILRKHQLEGLCEGHDWTITGPWFVYFLKRGPQDIPSSVNPYEIFHIKNQNSRMLKLAHCTAPICLVVHLLYLELIALPQASGQVQSSTSHSVTQS